MIRRGFTLVELIIGIMLMGILAGMMTLSPMSARQTAKKEAEKVTAFISSLVDRADRMRVGFTLSVSTNSMDVKWSPDLISSQTKKSLTASSRCSFTPSAQFLYYNVSPDAAGSLKKRFVYVTASTDVSGLKKEDYYYSIDVKGADSKIVHVLITSGDKR